MVVKGQVQPVLLLEVRERRRALAPQARSRVAVGGGARPVLGGVDVEPAEIVAQQLIGDRLRRGGVR